MKRGQAMPLERLQMLRCRVAPVPVKTVVGVEVVIAIHPAITGDLGKNRGCGDTAAPAVTLYETCLRKSETWNLEAIDKDMGRSNGKTFDCPAHRSKRGPADVPAIDTDRRYCTDPPRSAGSQNVGDQLFASLLSQKLRVTQPRDPGSGSQDYRGGNYRAGQASTPDLIHTGDLKTP